MQATPYNNCIDMSVSLSYIQVCPVIHTSVSRQTIHDTPMSVNPK